MKMLKKFKKLQNQLLYINKNSQTIIYESLKSVDSQIPTICSKYIMNYQEIIDELKKNNVTLSLLIESKNKEEYAEYLKDYNIENSYYPENVGDFGLVHSELTSTEDKDVVLYFKKHDIYLKFGASIDSYGSAYNSEYNESGWNPYISIEEVKPQQVLVTKYI